MTAEAIGRGDYVLGADFEGVRKAVGEAEKVITDSGAAAEKAFGDAGKQASSKFGDALKIGSKVAGTAVTATFAIATKGLIELEDVTADYRREAGATAEEAEKAGTAINRMSGRNIQPMHEIGAALAAVHTQMGLTGDAAENTTQLFLRFGRATGQESTEAVRSFDRVLKAWDLTAADAGALMDKLIVAHQKYGISVSDSQDALIRMAPQLKALNLNIDDGIALLNLFKTAGLDASIAQRALNTAITKLPPGTSLNDFIAHLGTITDDTRRAEEAMKVFGTRAGAGLANAIKPGMSSLDAFKITTDESTGAMERAAEAADSTFGARIQLAIKAFGAAANSAFKDAGPLLTGVAAIASGASTLGFGRLLEGLGPKLLAAMKTLGGKAAGAFGDGFGSIMEGAEGNVIGNLVADALERGSGRIKGAASRVAAATGLIWGLAFEAAAKVAELIATGLEAAGVSNLVRSAAVTAGLAAGGAFGTAIAVGMAIAIPAGVALILAKIADEIQKQHFGEQVNRAIFGEGGGPFKGVGDWMKSLDWPFGPKNAPDWARIGEETKQGATETSSGLVDALKTGAALANQAMAVLGPQLADSLATGKARIQTVAEDEGGLIQRGLTHGVNEAVTAVNNGASQILASLLSFRTRLRELAAGVADAVWGRIVIEAEIAQTKIDIAAQTHIINSKKSSAEEIRVARAKRDSLNETLFLQLNDLTSYGTAAQQVSAIKAALASKAVAKAYRDGTPEQRAAIDQWRQALLTKLGELQPAAHSKGQETTKSFAGGIKARDGMADVGSAVGKVVNKLDPLGNIPAAAWGGDVTKSFAAGILAYIGRVVSAAAQVALAVWNQLHSSVPERESPLYDLIGSGTHVIERLAAEMRAAAPLVSQALDDALGGRLTLPSSFAASSSSSINVGGRVEIGLSPDAAAALRAAGYNEREVAGALAGSVDLSGLLGAVRQRMALRAG